MLVKKAKGNPADDVSEFDEDIAAGQSSKLRGLAQLASSTSTDEPPANYINVGGEGESDDGGEADTQAMREQRDRSLPQGWKAFDDPKSGLCPGRRCTCGPRTPCENKTNSSALACHARRGAHSSPPASARRCTRGPASPRVAVCRAADPFPAADARAATPLSCAPAQACCTTCTSSPGTARGRTPSGGPSPLTSSAATR